MGEERPALTQEEFNRISTHNSQVAQLNRINALWDRANELCLSGRFVEYKFVLDRVWQELSPDSSKGEIKKQGKLDRILKKVFKIRTGEIQDIEMTLDNKWNKVNNRFKHKKIKKKSLLYKWVGRYENFLRKVQNNQGKGSSYREESSEGL